MSDVTRILSQFESGDPSAAEQLIPLVYDELRKLAAARLAHEEPGQTLQATALVHDAYLRLVDVEQAQRWNSRGHFFAAAAEAMRRILIERARGKGREKRGGRCGAGEAGAGIPREPGSVPPDDGARHTVTGAVRRTRRCQRGRASAAGRDGASCRLPERGASGGDVWV